MNNLYGWVFTFNPYNEIWSATTRENYPLLFNGTNKSNEHLVLRSRVHKTLVELIMKTEGDVDRILALIKPQSKRTKIKA